MRGESTSRQQYKGPSSSSPIEHLQLDVLFHGYELHFMSGGIMPGHRLLATRSRNGYNTEKTNRDAQRIMHEKYPLRRRTTPTLRRIARSSIRFSITGCPSTRAIGCPYESPTRAAMRTGILWSSVL